MILAGLSMHILACFANFCTESQLPLDVARVLSGIGGHAIQAAGLELVALVHDVKQRGQRVVIAFFCSAFGLTVSAVWSACV